MEQTLMAMKNNISFGKNGLTMIELSMVIIISSILIGVIYVAEKTIELAKITNAINLTAQSNLTDNDNLVLWLETSTMSKDKKNNESVKTWMDSSKNGIIFEAPSSSPTLRKGKPFEGIKGLYFNGTSYLQSDSPLNLSKYTAFIVSEPSNTNSVSLFDTGFLVKSSEISNNKVVVVKNDGSKKYIKRGNTKNFEQITNSDVLNNRPSKFYIGNGGFKGKILEIIIFDKVLSDKEIIKIENYLYNKYMR